MFEKRILRSDIYIDCTLLFTHDNDNDNENSLFWHIENSLFWHAHVHTSTFLHCLVYSG